MKKKQSGAQADSRLEAQTNENLKVEKVDAPDSRFQQEQQVNPTISAGDNQVADQSFITKKTKASGGTLKQEIASEVIKGKASGVSSSVNSPSSYGLKEVSFSGDTGTILGSSSATPIMDKDIQGKTRVDKRLSDANKDINYNASEQILVEYDNIPPLAESDSTVGYNGNPKNAAARSQKKTGFTSAEMLYDRSLDYLEKDAFVFSCGQVVRQGDEDAGVTVDDAGYPTLTIDPETHEYVPFDTPLVRGNFSPRNLKVAVTKDSSGVYISNFEVEEDDLSCNFEEDVTVNKSGSSHKIDLNRAELSRQTIDAKAGSPTAEHFNPLGRSIKQPTRTVTYLQDIENVMGSTVFSAYKFAQKARGHYLNRTAKDGQDLIAPAVDALYGNLIPMVDRETLMSSYLPDSNNPLFSKEGMRHGSAALMIALFDSVNKYNTKADVVNQPRGLKMHLQTADNNMDPFRVKNEFVSAINSIDAYSTIDRGYDPMGCVAILDNVRLIHPYSWRNALRFHRESALDKVYDSQVFAYKYSAGSGVNSYIINVGEPVLNGVAYFLDLHAKKLYSILADKANDNGTVELTIPIVHSTTHFSLWDFLICASTPYIIYERTNALKDILDFEVFHEYPLTGNTPIKSANPMGAVNYKNSSPLEPLTVQQMLPSSAIRWIWPETMQELGTGGDAMAPWYFNERSYDWISSIGNDELISNGSSNLTTPVIRSGIRLAYLDDFFSMDVKDVLLCLDRMVRMPGFKDSEKFNGYVYKYGQESDGLIMLRQSSYESITLKKWMSTPRMMGWFFDAPGGTCSPLRSNERDTLAYSSLTAVTDNDGDDTGVTYKTAGTSFRAISFKGIYADANALPDNILQPGSVNVSRGQNFTQYWAARVAGGNGYSSPAFDLLLSLNDSVDVNTLTNTTSLVDKRSIFTPFIKSRYSASKSGNKMVADNLETGNKVFSIHRALWTIMQKLPFILNPFDRGFNTAPGADPFSVAYVFGLAGFMAADYNEEDYNRINQIQEQGFGFVSDPFVSASPVFKDSYKHTEI